MFNLLIISTLICILEGFAPIIISCIIKWLYARPASDLLMHAELMNIKEEMNSISIVDEFSKYARLQRKYNKLENEYKETVNAWSSTKSTTQMKITYGFRMFNVLLNSVLIYLYHGEIVIDFPKGILWPLEGILSWPSHSETGISFLQWIVISKLAVSTFK